MRVLPPKIATNVAMLKFHTADYLEALSSGSEMVSPIESNGEGLDAETCAEFGLEHDCELFPRAWDMCRLVAGASLTAADELVFGRARAAVNWGGGRHHAKKSEASGFCFVNDVVLAILHLQTRFERVLYLDVDVHHGGCRIVGENSTK
jgi:acetoin utilization deacetylase AcuC-like enzyme